MPRKKSEDKWSKLPEDWRTGMLAQPSVLIKTEITTTALNQVALEAAEELDPDVPSLKEQLKTATEQYREGKKQNKLKIRFLAEVLKGRGEAVPAAEDFLRAARNGELAPPPSDA